MDKNYHDGHRKRVRERYLNSGMDSFEDHQVLELLLFYCIPRKDTNEIAHRLLDEFGTLHNLFDSSPENIAKICDLSENSAVFLSMIPDILRRYTKSKFGKKIVFDSSKKAGEFAIGLLECRPIECLFIICMNLQHSLIHYEMLSDGILSEAPIYLREITEAALKHNAASIIIAHNHPGGALAASEDDIASTKKIIKVLKEVNVEVIDHIIVAEGKYLSFAEKGILKLYY